MNKKWIAYNKDYSLLPEYISRFNISELTARVLINRDINTIEKAELFLNSNLNKLYSPFLMKDMNKAVDYILQAIQSKKKICVYGDYDVDGITSTVISIQILRQLDADVIYYIPNRVEEGYGLNIEAIEYLKLQGVDLILTVDCGIRSIEAAEFAKSIGIDLIITDHHECGEQLPDALCILNPHRNDCSYPFKELAGVGVAFKLMQAITIKVNRSELQYEILDIVSIGTIADIVSLVDENRVIVKYGLEIMENTHNVGLKALLDVCNLSGHPINTYNIAYMVAPRINAAGRIANASLCVELLLTSNKELAYQISKELDCDNKERQNIENNILISAIDKIEHTIDLESTEVIVLEDESWHIGVVGIVASKIVEKYYKPAILIATEGLLGKGSARSVNNFNLYEALNNCSDLFEKFGGHELAAGITIKRDKISTLRDKINIVASEMLNGKPLIPELKVDYKLSSSDIKMNIARELEHLEPFGAGNQSPLFVFRNLKVITNRTVGSDNKHLLLTVHDGKNEIRGIGFNLGSYNNILSFGKKVDIICNVERNQWNDVEQLQLKIKDLRLTKI